MIILQLLAVAVQMFAVPLLLGRIIKYDEDTMTNYVMGLFASLAIFQLLALPFAAFKMPFNLLCLVYLIIETVLCAISVVKDRKFNMIQVHKILKSFSVYECLYLLGIIILLFAQLYFAVFYQSGNMTGDDYEYVVTAADDVATNRISASFLFDGEPWRVSPRTGTTGWIAYTAFLSKISGLSVATVCHTILPVVLLLTAYIIYWVLDRFLIEKRENQLVFMLLLEVAIIFGLYSHNSMTFRLLATLWQGKAVFTCLSVPYLLMMITRIFDDKTFKEGLPYMLIMTIGSSCFTLLGTGLIVAIMAALCVLVSIHKRRITGLGMTLVCSIYPLIQAGMYLYIYEVILGYNVV